MTIDQIEKALDFFFEDKKQKVLFLKGPWGAGKSFFVRSYLEKSPLVPDLQYFVSLFGLCSLNEVRETINASFKKRLNPKRSKFATWRARFFNIDAIPKLLKKAPEFHGFSVSSIGASLFWLIAKQFDSVVIFDDLERAKLAAHEILGLASTLAENSKAKIIVIFNDGELSGEDLKKINQYREKVVDMEILFKPNATELIANYLDDKSIGREVAELFDSIGSTNIRLIQKINTHLSRLKEKMSENGVNLDCDDLVHAAKIICLQYQSRLTLTRELISGGFLGWGRRAEKNEQTEDEKHFGKLLEALKIFPPYNFDECLFEIMQNGYCSKKTFQKFIEDYKTNSFQQKYREDLIKAYSSYGDNFTGSIDDVFADMKVFLDEYSDKMSTEEFLRQLDFLKSLSYPKSMEPWLKRHLPVVDKITNSQERLAFAERLLPSECVSEYLASLRILPALRRDPLEIIKKINKSRSWSSEDSVELDSMKEKEVYDWIVSCGNNRFIDELRTIRNSWRGNETNPATSFVRKVEAALRQIAKRSKLDQIRINFLFDID